MMGAIRKSVVRANRKAITILVIVITVISSIFLCMILINTDVPNERHIYQGHGIVEGDSRTDLVLSRFENTYLYFAVIAENDIYFGFNVTDDDRYEVAQVNRQLQFQASWARGVSEGRLGAGYTEVSYALMVFWNFSANRITFTFRASWRFDYNTTDYQYLYWWSDEHQAPWEIDDMFGVPHWDDPRWVSPTPRLSHHCALDELEAIER